MQRSQIINLAAGPSSLPEAVLTEAAAGLLNYDGTGIGVTELSHRSPEFSTLTKNLESQIRSILDVPQTHVILFTQGGGCGMFSSVVYNLLARHHLLYPNLTDEERTLDYVVTGNWSKKAAEEARLLTVGTKANVNVVVDAREHSASGKAFDRIPSHDKWKFSPAPAFVYYCDNETVDGVQFSNDLKSPAAFPHHLLPHAVGSEMIAPIPLVGDHSSSFLSRPILNMGQHALIYAGAQKNVGPSGLTILIVRKDLLVDTASAAKLGAPPTPTTMSYKVLADAGSLYNTPPMFSMYASLLAVKYYKENGGLGALKKLNEIKQKKMYDALDEGVQKGVYEGRVERDSRSWMNVTFTLKNPGLEKMFLASASEKGIRISLYNAVTEQQVDIVTSFMRQFVQEHAVAAIST
ncbi:Phosphoserine transaminase [Tulasnella sp. 330]|nr:Phosphoserine transaminase [Tulasnella sp. 330]KAG8874104.1 Phosphoserine transaminase [Tulasnella sp. 331]KAG8889371.1 Phosphoserine transaminase [Tulasnella sp. 332]